jgi:hypothetical protein
VLVFIWYSYGWMNSGMPEKYGKGIDGAGMLPFQGAFPSSPGYPGRLPWAELYCPFRATARVMVNWNPIQRDGEGYGAWGGVHLRPEGPTYLSPRHGLGGKDERKMRPGRAAYRRFFKANYSLLGLLQDTQGDALG